LQCFNRGLDSTGIRLSTLEFTKKHRLKIRRWQQHAGSSPATGTIPEKRAVTRYSGSGALLYPAKLRPENPNIPPNVPPFSDIFAVISYC